LNSFAKFTARDLQARAPKANNDRDRTMRIETKATYSFSKYFSLSASFILSGCCAISSLSVSFMRIFSICAAAKKN
jgi:hypothetical protein